MVERVLILIAFSGNGVIWAYNLYNCFMIHEVNIGNPKPGGICDHMSLLRFTVRQLWRMSGAQVFNFPSPNFD
jgi:hypothetical protein